MHFATKALLLLVHWSVFVNGQSTDNTQAVRLCAASDDEMRMCLDMARQAQQFNMRMKREAAPDLHSANDRDRTQGGGGSAFDHDRRFAGNYFLGSNSNPVRNDMSSSSQNSPMDLRRGQQPMSTPYQQPRPQYSSGGVPYAAGVPNGLGDNNNNINKNSLNFNSLNNLGNDRDIQQRAAGGGPMNFGTQIKCVRATDNYDCMKLIGDPDSQRSYKDLDQDLYAHAVLLGPAEAYIAVNNYQMTPIAVELVPETDAMQPNIAGLPQPFLARLVAVTTGDIQSINDIRGKRFCYAKANDTLGWFLSNAVLERSSIISAPNACNSSYLHMVAGSSQGSCVPNTWQDYSDDGSPALRAQLCQCEGINCNIANRYQYPSYTDAIRCLTQDSNKDVAFTTDAAIREALAMHLFPPAGGINILPPPMNNNNYPPNDPRRQQQQQPMPTNINNNRGTALRPAYHLVCPVPDPITQRTVADLSDDDMCNWGQMPTRVWLASQTLDRNTLLDLQSHIKRFFDSAVGRGSNDQWFTQYFSPDYPRLSQNEQMRKRAVGMSKTLLTQNDPQQLFQQYAGFAYPLLMANDFTTCSDKVKSGKIKWCTTSQLEMEKCRVMMQAFRTIQMEPSLDCVRQSSPRQCMQALDSEMADLATFDAADAYRGYFWYYLTPLLQERYGNEDYMYSIAVVRTNGGGGASYYGGDGSDRNNPQRDNGGDPRRRNDPRPQQRQQSQANTSPINSLSDLKDKRICFSGYGDAAGWIEPMATLKNFEVIDGYSSWDFKDFGEAADRMFGPSCAPGANQDDSNPGRTGSSKLCQQCSTDSTVKCGRNADEVYNGPDGAINCLRDGAGDIAFLPHTGLLALTDEERNNYQLLCPGMGTRNSANWKGVTTQPLMNYQSCNFGRVPASFVMTSYKKQPYVRNLLIEYMMKAQEVFGQNPFVGQYWQGGGGGGGGRNGGGIRPGGVPDDVLMSLYPGITPNSFMMFAPRNRTDNYARRNRVRLQMQQQSQRFGDNSQLSVVGVNTTYYGIFTMGTTELVPLPQPASLPAYISARFHDDMILVDWDLHRNGATQQILNRVLIVTVMAALVVARLPSIYRFDFKQN